MDTGINRVKAERHIPTSGTNREMKKARQGVVGLARASDIHYKREKKVDA
jgi:hypothetical protein